MLHNIETTGKNHLSLFIQYMESVFVCVCKLDALTARVMANRAAAAAAAAQQIAGVESSDAGASVM
jgi:hypothetical protein